MKKDELRIRIIPEDGQVLIEPHTDGIMSTVDFCRQIVSMSKSIRTGTRNIVSGTRVYMQISATMRRRI